VLERLGLAQVGRGVRFHSVDYVIEQVLRVVERYGIQAIHFEDDSLGADRARLLELCEAMRRRGLHKRIVWDACLRVDQVDGEQLAQMKSAGCIQVEYGFESGSDAVLRRLGKNATVEQNRRAVRLSREEGLRVYADIMVGLPGETEADMRATMQFMRWARPEVLSVSRLCPLPGTPVYAKLPEEAREGIDWGEYSYDQIAERFNLTAMPDERYSALYHEWGYALDSRSYYI